MPCQILGGILAEKFGGKWVVGLSTLGCGIVSILIPSLARINSGSAWPMFFARVVEGAFQGPMLPATYSMMAKWLPRPEKPFLMAVISAGKNLSDYLISLREHIYKWRRGYWAPEQLLLFLLFFFFLVLFLFFCACFFFQNEVKISIF